MAEEQKPEKKVSTVEIIFMILLALIMELFELFLGLLLVGEITNPITNIFNTLTFGFWFTMKGIKLPTFMVGSALEFIPIINLLPIRLAAVIITIVVANSATLSKATGVVNTAKNVAHAADQIKAKLKRPAAA